LASIDTTALEHNLNQVRRLVGNAHIWSVVKARAYGHSLRAALKGLSKTDGFALLDIDDARWLREQGWTGRLLLLEGLFRYEDLASAHELGCDLVVHREEQLIWLEDAKKTSLTLFLKLNSGMNRLGFLPEAYRLAFHRLHALGYSVNHLSHFANADRVDRSPSVGDQMECFTQTIEGLPSGETCLANSAAILWHRNALGDWVRPGIMLLGISPTGIAQDIAHAGLQPVMTLSSEIIAIQDLKAGDCVGYGGRYQAKQAMRMGVVACGYADGYPRHAPDGSPVWVYGKSLEQTGVICPLAGQVSMDMITVDLTNAPWAQVGYRVELWGRHLPVDDVAIKSQTIGYELVCAIAPRVPVEII